MGNDQFGGGIYISRLTVTLEMVVLENNKALEGGAVYVSSRTPLVDLVGCKFSGNSAIYGDDIFQSSDDTINIDGCPAGFFGAAGAALDTGGTITGDRKSYSCVACVR